MTFTSEIMEQLSTRIGQSRSPTVDEAKVLRALCENGDLSWLTKGGTMHVMLDRLSGCLEAIKQSAVEAATSRVQQGFAEKICILENQLQSAAQEEHERFQQVCTEKDHSKQLLSLAEGKLQEYQTQIRDLEQKVAYAIKKTVEEGTLASLSPANSSSREAAKTIQLCSSAQDQHGHLLAQADALLAQAAPKLNFSDKQLAVGLRQFVSEVKQVLHDDEGAMQQAMHHSEETNGLIWRLENAFPELCQHCQDMSTRTGELKAYVQACAQRILPRLHGSTPAELSQQLQGLLTAVEQHIKAQANILDMHQDGLHGARRLLEQHLDPAQQLTRAVQQQHSLAQEHARMIERNTTLEQLLAEKDKQAAMERNRNEERMSVLQQKLVAAGDVLNEQLSSALEERTELVQRCAQLEADLQQARSQSADATKVREALAQRVEALAARVVELEAQKKDAAQQHAQRVEELQAAVQAIASDAMSAGSKRSIEEAAATAAAATAQVQVLRVQLAQQRMQQEAAEAQHKQELMELQGRVGDSPRRPSRRQQGTARTDSKGKVTGSKKGQDQSSAMHTGKDLSSWRQKQDASAASATSAALLDSLAQLLQHMQQQAPDAQPAHASRAVMGMLLCLEPLQQLQAFLQSTEVDTNIMEHSSRIPQAAVQLLLELVCALEAALDEAEAEAAVLAELKAQVQSLDAECRRLQAADKKHRELQARSTALEQENRHLRQLEASLAQRDASMQATAESLQHALAEEVSALKQQLHQVEGLANRQRQDADGQLKAMQQQLSKEQAAHQQQVEKLQAELKEQLRSVGQAYQAELAAIQQQLSSAAAPLKRNQQLAWPTQVAAESSGSSHGLQDHSKRSAVAEVLAEARRKLATDLEHMPPQPAAPSYMGSPAFHAAGTQPHKLGSAAWPQPGTASSQHTTTVVPTLADEQLKLKYEALKRKYMRQSLRSHALQKLLTQPSDAAGAELAYQQLSAPSSPRATSPTHSRHSSPSRPWVPPGTAPVTQLASKPSLATVRVAGELNLRSLVHEARTASAEASAAGGRHHSPRQKDRLVGKARAKDAASNADGQQSRAHAGAHPSPRAQTTHSQQGHRRKSSSRTRGDTIATVPRKVANGKGKD